MKKDQVLIRSLAITGTVLVGLPLVAPIVFGVIFLIMNGRFLLDYLMPAELFLMVMAGGLLLFWAAWRFRSKVKQIGWGLAAAAGSLALTQGFAEITGLAHGDNPAEGWRLALVMSFLVLYILMVVWIFVSGIYLLSGLFGRTKNKNSVT